MTGLSHKQVRQLLHLAADKSLNPADRAAADAHVSQCAACQAYAVELTLLDAAIGSALKAHWAAPRRSPIDIAARVRRRMWQDSERAFVTAAAQVVLKLGTMATVAMLAIGVLQSANYSAGPASYAEVAPPAVDLRHSLPAFEFETERSTERPPTVRQPKDEEHWMRPTPVPNGLRAVS